MDPHKIYEYLTLSRARVLDKARTLSPEEWTRPFEIGLGTLARTLTHVMVSEGYYIARLLRRDVPPYHQWPIRDENPPPFAALEEAWTNQAAATRAALRSVQDWNALLTYRVTDDDGRVIEVTTTNADLFTQLALHEVHHRAQALNMLRQMGRTVEGDIDFNAMMYERREVG